MSITSELRLFAADPYTGWVPTDKQQADLRAIANRIDAEHESACAEAYANGVESVALPDMASYVKLPVDADGVPIRVGDMMERGEARGHVIALMLSEYPKKWGGALHWAIQLEGEHAPTAYDLMFHHYHAPTVEDVLEEFVARWMDTHHDDIPALKAEYAAKLRLAEGEGA